MSGKTDRKPTTPEKVNHIIPSNLRGLQLAAYLLKCLTGGESESQIAERFGGDRQLIKMWKCFLIHNHWIEEKNEGVWQVTSNGAEALKKHRPQMHSVSV